MRSREDPPVAFRWDKSEQEIQLCRSCVTALLLVKGRLGVGWPDLARLLTFLHLPSRTDRMARSVTDLGDTLAR
jgi:hypothetical protein